MCNAYTELNDPVVQREMFQLQSKVCLISNSTYNSNAKLALSLDRVKILGRFLAAKKNHREETLSSSKKSCIMGNTPLIM